MLVCFINCQLTSHNIADGVFGMSSQFQSRMNLFSNLKQFTKMIITEGTAVLWWVYSQVSVVFTHSFIVHRCFQDDVIDQLQREQPRIESLQIKFFFQFFKFFFICPFCDQFLKQKAMTFLNPKSTLNESINPVSRYQYTPI